MSDFEKLIATVTSSNNAAALRDKEQLDQDKKNLEVLRTSLENLGGKAEDNKAFNKAALKVQMDEFDLRKNLATGSAAKEEIEKERQKALGDAIGNSKTFQGKLGVTGSVKLVAAIVALGALFAPSLVLAGVKTAIKGFTAAIAATARGITSLGRDTFVDNSGRTRDKKTGAFAKKEGKLGGVKAFGKGLLRGVLIKPKNS